MIPRLKVRREVSKQIPRLPTTFFFSFRKFIKINRIDWPTKPECGDPGRRRVKASGLTCFSSPSAAGYYRRTFCVFLGHRARDPGIRLITSRGLDFYFFFLHTWLQRRRIIILSALFFSTLVYRKSASGERLEAKKSNEKKKKLKNVYKIISILSSGDRGVCVCMCLRRFSTGFICLCVC